MVEDRAKCSASRKSSFIINCKCSSNKNCAKYYWNFKVFFPSDILEEWKKYKKCPKYLNTESSSFCIIYVYGYALMHTCDLFILVEYNKLIISVA